MDRRDSNSLVMALEDLSSSIMQIVFQVTNASLEELEEKIIAYIHKNYPSINLEFGDLSGVINKVYNEKNRSLKNNIDVNIGRLRYNLEGTDNIDEIIEQEINQYNALFTSISNGTNVNYLGLVDKCSENIMSVLIRKNNSIKFANRIGEVTEYVHNLVSDNYKVNMGLIGDSLLEGGFLPDNGNSKIKTGEFF